ncbi:tape measure protein [Kocuria rosea]|uniref:tape measure protein n=1 Tax=Kocuria rosea TaxID=1275 RepID=UPI003D333B89
MAIVELAAAAVPIFPSVRGLQKNLARELAPASSIAGRVGGETGSRFRASFSKSVSGVASALGTALKAGALAGGAVAAAAGAVGIKTAAQMETAQISFTTMLGSGEKARAFLGELSSFAAKTPFDLPGLQTSAQSLVSAGISADKVIPIMTTLGNVTSGMGTGAEGIQRATVAIQQMNAAGKIQAEDLNQLRDAGIPVYDLLAAATGRSKAELAEMIDKGELGRKELDQLMSALESGKGFERFNGLMDAQSQSLTGLWATLKDTFSVGMAEAIGPAIPLLKDGLAGAITAVGSVMPHVQAGLAGMVSGIQGFVRGVTGDVEIMSTSTRPKLELFGLGVRALWLAFQDGQVTSDGFVGVMERIGVALGKARDAGRAFIENLRSGDTSSVGGSFRSIGESLGVLLPKLVEAGASAVPMLNTAISAGAGVLAFMADNTWLLAGAIPALTAGFVAWKTLQTANTVLGRQSAIGMGLQVASTIALAASNRALASSQHAVIASQSAAAASRGATTAATGAQTAATATNTTATAANTTAQNGGILARGRAVVAMAAQRAATIATSVATKAAAAGQWLLNAALTANPVGIVVVALAALAGGLVLAWKHSDTFRSIVMGAWEGVKSAASSVASWFTTTAVPVFKSALSAVGSAFSWLNNTIIQPVWTGIRFTVAVVAGTLMTIFDGLVWVVRNTLGPVFTWLYNNAIKPAFDWARAKVEGFRSWFDTTRLLVQGYLGALGARFVGLYNTYVRPALDWTRTKIGDVLNWFNVKRLEMQVRLQMLGLKFLALYHVHVKPVFDWVRTKIGDVLNWFNIKRVELQDRLQILGTRFRSLYNEHVRPVFDWVRDKITGVWSAIKSKAFDPMSKFARETIPNAFRAAQEGVGRQWEKLRGIVRGPVDFFVNTVYNNGLRPNINTVLEKVGLQDKRLPEMKMPKGFASGGVLPGYQPRKIDDMLHPVRGGGVQPLRGGEGILVPEVVRGAGRGLVDTLNAAGNRGVGAVKKLLSDGLAKGGIVKPLRRMALTQGYNRVHKGVDLAASVGTPVYATSDGTVSHAGSGARAPGVWGGNEIHVRGGGLERWFAHLSEIAVRVGQRVKAGQMIGRSGNTGISSGPHLHFGVFRGGWPNDINPLSYLGGNIPFSDGADDGGGFLSALLDPVTSLVSGIGRKVTDKFGGNLIADMVGGMAKTIGSGALDWVTDQALRFGDIMKDVAVAGARVVSGVGNRVKGAAWMAEALRHTGDWSLTNQNAGVRRMQQESNFDPNAVNNWDSNARAGTPSKGVMQVIGPTFSQYRDRSLPNNILDPVANIVASINYTKSRYGSLTAGWNRAGGYARGGIIPELHDQGGIIRPGVNVIENRTRKPEVSVNPRQWDITRDALAAVQDQASRGAGGVQFNAPVYAVDPDDLWRTQMKAQRRQEALYGA